MLPPGAPMSGLSARSGDRPYELNVEIRLPAGFVTLVTPDCHVRVVVPAAISASSAAPSAAVMPTTGMVIAGEPATVAFRKPAPLLYRTTAEAPATCAL